MMEFEELYNNAIEEIKKGDLQSAYQFLLKSIQDINANVTDFSDNHIHNIIHNNERPLLVYKLNGLPLLDKAKTLQTIYHKSGEIAAKLGKAKEAKSHFENYQKMVMYSFDGFKTDEHLFSFRNFNEHTLYDLANNSLSISRPKVMNDPFDTPVIEWGKYQRTHNLKPHTEQFVKSFDGYRIRSFSIPEKGKHPLNDLLMWAHYANGHRGFCVEYSFSSEFRKTLLLSFNHINYGVVDLSKDKLSITEAFATKSVEWRYENEVRLISYNSDSNDEHINVPLDDQSSIVAIYFGLNCPEKRIDIIKRLMEGKNAKLYRMEAKGSSIPYELIPVSI